MTHSPRRESIFSKSGAKSGISKAMKAGRASLLINNSVGKSSSLLTYRSQLSGTLQMKPFYKSYFNTWSKYYFVLKDMFLIWYKRNPGPCNFGLHPSGFIPLQGCVITPEGQDGSGYVFKVTNQGFKGQELLLKADTGGIANDWEKSLTMCANISPESIRVGKVLLLESQSKEQSKERLRKLEEARAKAAEAQESKKEKQLLMEVQMKQRKENARKLKKKNKLAKQKAIDASFVRKEIETKTIQLDRVEAKYKGLIGNFESSKEATNKLRTLVLQHKGPNKERILKNIEQIYQIFDDIDTVDDI